MAANKTDVTELLRRRQAWLKLSSGVIKNVYHTGGGNRDLSVRGANPYANDATDTDSV